MSGLVWSGGVVRLSFDRRNGVTSSSARGYWLMRLRSCRHLAGIGCPPFWGRIGQAI